MLLNGQNQSPVFGTSFKSQSNVNDHESAPSNCQFVLTLNSFDEQAEEKNEDDKESRISCGSSSCNGEPDHEDASEEIMNVSANNQTSF